MFSNASGLEVNKHKNYVGMFEEVIQRVNDVSGFKAGRLPFRYIGVPISVENSKLIIVKLRLTE